MTPRSINYPKVIPLRRGWVHDGRHETWPTVSGETKQTFYVDHHPERCICTDCRIIRGDKQ